MADGLRRQIDDFGKATVLFDPVSQRPSQECQNPVTLDLFLVTDLKLVKGEVVFEFAKRFFNAPAQEISFDDGLGREEEIIGNKDVKIFFIIVGPFIEDEKDRKRSRAIFKFRLERVSEDGFGFTIFLKDGDGFKFMREEFFDERNDLIDAQIDTLFGFRVNKKDGAVGFNFSDEEKAEGVNKLNEIRRSIPSVEDNGEESKILMSGFEDEIFGKVEFTFKIFGKSVRDVGFKVKGTMFGRRYEAGGDRDVAIFLSMKRSAVLDLSAFGFKGVRFRGSGVIDGENRFGRRFCGDLIIEDA